MKYARQRRRAVLNKLYADPNAVRVMVIFTIMIVCTSISAQRVSTVHNDDGQKFRGEIIGQDTRSVILRTLEMDTIYLSKANIRYIKKSKKHINLYRKHQKKGVFYHFDILSNVTEFSGTSSLSFTTGLRLRDRLLLGVGIAQTIDVFDFGPTQNAHVMLQPYGFSRYHLNQKSNRLFVEGKLGWGFAAPTEGRDIRQGGIFVQPSFGIEIATKKKLSWTIKLSHYIQHTSGVDHFTVGFDRNLPASIRYKSLLRRTGLSIGISF